MTTADAEPIELELPGLRLAGLAWGPGDGLPVLATHGWLDNAASFARLAPLLPNLRLVALDLPGHGLSEHRPPGVAYHFVDWIVDVAAAADALGWTRFGLLGHSMGASIASLVAGTLRERITHLALIEGLGPMSCAAEEAPHRLARSIERRAAMERKRPRAHSDLETAVERLLQVNPSLDEGAARILVERGTRPAAEGAGITWRSDPRLRGLSPLRMSEAHVHAFLRRIACPTLLIKGREGAAFDMKTIAARVDTVRASGAPCAVEEVPGGHHLHLTDPQPVAALLGPFFGKAHEPWLTMSPAELGRVAVNMDDLTTLKAIELLVLDVDGVLTSGALEYGSDGTDRYTFSVWDGMGIKALQRSGIEVAIISGRSSEPVLARARDLKIERVYLGVEHKLPRLKALTGELGIDLQRVAYIGDDINDIPILRAVGYPAAPANARPEVLRLARFVTGRSGGQGAVRELAEHILKFQGKWEQAVAYYDVPPGDA